jgi:hypothetical protein
VQRLDWIDLRGSVRGEVPGDGCGAGKHPQAEREGDGIDL